jgi:predicted nucleic acid-binding Zn ribbon protein
MESLHSTATHALRALLDAQPATPAKVAFAWRMVAGAALARAGDPEWREGVLVVRARTDAWRRELRRAKPVLTARLQELVGADVVKKIVIE